MKFFSECANALTEFLFPRSASVLVLEGLSPGEMVRMLPSAEPIDDDRVVAVFSYAHPTVRDLVWELKYRGNATVAEKLAAVLVDVLSHELAERALYENFTDPLLVPMPISDKRKAARGYNQTEILAAAMIKLDQNTLFTYNPRLLRKTSHTESQARTHATRRERAENLQHSMHISESTDETARGKNIVLLDDVTTSGATFNEARRALKAAGARKILCLAVAH